MKLAECISQLFDCSERLYAVRADLLETVESVNDYNEQVHMSLSVKAVDLSRVMLLYEYELLDTAHIIQDEHVSLYYARRVEILVMTKEQISGYLRELEDLRGRVSHPQSLDCIDQAVGVIRSSLGFLNETVALLRSAIVTAGNGQTRH